MKSSRSAFPSGVFLISVSVIAIIICLGGCIIAANSSSFAYVAYAVALLALSLGGGLVIALVSGAGAPGWRPSGCAATTPSSRPICRT